MDQALSKDDVIPQIWNAYTKSKEYADGARMAIPPHHQLVENQEREGLREVYKRIEKDLREKSALEQRTIGDWMSEWQQMHSLLFHRILKEHGGWRKVEVRFGDPADLEGYNIPLPNDVPREIMQLAFSMREVLSVKDSQIENQYRALAQFHYQFIRIHPFPDGNGRISRAITDQIAIYFGLPSAMAGYPRNDSKRRVAYHKAIQGCIDDSSCELLSLWIAGYIKDQLDNLA